MIDPHDVHSLSDFQRNTKGHIRRMKKTQRPVVLTVNGKAALVIQDIETYTRTSSERARESEIVAVLDGLRQARAGLSKPIEEFEREFRTRRAAGRKARRKSA